MSACTEDLSDATCHGIIVPTRYDLTALRILFYEATTVRYRRQNSANITKNKTFQWRVFSYEGVENMWLLEIHEKGLHILGGCLNIWLQGFRPFFLFSLR